LVALASGKMCRSEEIGLMTDQGECGMASSWKAASYADKQLAPYIHRPDLNGRCTAEPNLVGVKCAPVWDILAPLKMTADGSWAMKMGDPQWRTAKTG